MANTVRLGDRVKIPDDSLLCAGREGTVIKLFPQSVGIVLDNDGPRGFMTTVPYGFAKPVSTAKP